MPARGGTGGAVGGLGATQVNQLISQALNSLGLAGIRFGTSFPGSPSTGTIVIFTDDVDSGLANIGSADEGDVVRYSGTAWVKIYAFGDLISAIAGMAGTGVNITYANVFPPSPNANDYHINSEGNLDVSGQGIKDFDGTTNLTTLAIGDFFRHNGTAWVKIGNVRGGGGGRSDADILGLVRSSITNNLVQTINQEIINRTNAVNQLSASIRKPFVGVPVSTWSYQSSGTSPSQRRFIIDENSVQIHNLDTTNTSQTAELSAIVEGQAVIFDVIDAVQGIADNDVFVVTADAIDRSTHYELTGYWLGGVTPSSYVGDVQISWIEHFSQLGLLVLYRDIIGADPTDVKTLTLSGNTLLVTKHDGTTESLTLPTGGGGGTNVFVTYADNTAIPVNRFVTYNDGIYWTTAAIASDNTTKPDAHDDMERLDNIDNSFLIQSLEGRTRNNEHLLANLKRNTQVVWSDTTEMQFGLIELADGVSPNRTAIEGATFASTLTIDSSNNYRQYILARVAPGTDIGLYRINTNIVGGETYYLGANFRVAWENFGQQGVVERYDVYVTRAHDVVVIGEILTAQKADRSQLTVFDGITPGRTESEVNQQIAAAVPPAGTIEIVPHGVDGVVNIEGTYDLLISHPSPHISEVDTIDINFGGVEVYTGAWSPVANNVEPEPYTPIVFSISSTNAQSIQGNLGAGVTYIRAEIEFKDGSTVVDTANIAFLLNLRTTGVVELYSGNPGSPTTTILPNEARFSHWDMLSFVMDENPRRVVTVPRVQFAQTGNDGRVRIGGGNDVVAYIDDRHFQYQDDALKIYGYRVR